MKAHKYWSVGALITMLGTFYTGYKKQKSSTQILCFKFYVMYGNGDIYRS